MSKPSERTYRIGLIGLPGSGKTSLLGALAARSHRVQRDGEAELIIRGGDFEAVADGLLHGDCPTATSDVNSTHRLSLSLPSNRGRMVLEFEDYAGELVIWDSKSLDWHVSTSGHSVAERIREDWASGRVQGVLVLAPLFLSNGDALAGKDELALRKTIQAVEALVPRGDQAPYPVVGALLVTKCDRLVRGDGALAGKLKRRDLESFDSLLDRDYAAPSWPLLRNLRSDLVGLFEPGNLECFGTSSYGPAPEDLTDFGRFKLSQRDRPVVRGNKALCSFGLVGPLSWMIDRIQRQEDALVSSRRKRAVRRALSLFALVLLLAGATTLLFAKSRLTTWDTHAAACQAPGLGLHARLQAENFFNSFSTNSFWANFPISVLRDHEDAASLLAQSRATRESEFAQHLDRARDEVGERAVAQEYLRIFSDGDDAGRGASIVERSRMMQRSAEIEAAITTWQNSPIISSEDSVQVAGLLSEIRLDLVTFGELGQSAEKRVGRLLLGLDQRLVRIRNKEDQVRLDELIGLGRFDSAVLLGDEWEHVKDGSSPARMVAAEELRTGLPQLLSDFVSGHIGSREWGVARSQLLAYDRWPDGWGSQALDVHVGSLAALVDQAQDKAMYDRICEKAESGSLRPEDADQYLGAAPLGAMAPEVEALARYTFHKDDLRSDWTIRVAAARLGAGNGDDEVMFTLMLDGVPVIGETFEVDDHGTLFRGDNAHKPIEGAFPELRSLTDPVLVSMRAVDVDVFSDNELGSLDEQLPLGDLDGHLFYLPETQREQYVLLQIVGLPRRPTMPMWRQ